MSVSTSSREDEDKAPVEETATQPDTKLGTDIGLLSEVEHFSNGSFSSEDVEIIAAHLDDRNAAEAQAVLEEAINYHHGDVCLSQTYYDHMRKIVTGPLPDQTEEEWEALIKFDAFLIKDWSIYPEVRSVTRPIDEESDVRYETLRVYIISCLWSCAGSVLAQFFFVRFPTISMNSVAIQLLIAYSGKVMRFIPDWSFPIGFGSRIYFGGGRWSYKEQMLATCGMGVGNNYAYSSAAIMVMANKNFFGFEGANSFGFIILLTLSSNLMGFGLSGIFRVFLVYPTRMLWYSVLPSLKLSRSLVRDDVRENINGWRLKGWEFFWLFSFLEFGWYWITDFVFEFLGYFDWMAWIDHTNNNLLSVCGVNGGLGLNPFPSMDWSVFLPTPMVSPFFATASILFGMGISACAICVIFWTNVRYTSYLPINSNSLYDNRAEPFQVARILNSEHKLDEEKYQHYSLPYWSAGSIVQYGSFFMFYPAMIVYSILNYYEILVYSGKIFVRSMLHPRTALNSFDDRFTRAQRKHKEVPEWAYLGFLCACVGMGIAVVEHWKFTNTPVWTIFFGIGLSAGFMVPCGVLWATTNQQVEINVLFELIIGLACEGNASALMISKVFATNFMSETDTFLSNLKTGHYCGIAPWPMFRIQVVNMIANSFVQSGLITWQASPDPIRDMCDPNNREKFTCQNQRTYFNAAVQWGTIGPKRIFKKGGLYPSMRWVFLIGACYPIPFWIVRQLVVRVARRRNWGAVKEGGSRLRNSGYVRSLISLEWINGINEMVVIQGGLMWAPQNFMYFIPWLYVGLFFQVYLPRYYPRWWQKYNYLLYAAISVGYSYAGLIQFFATSYNHIAQINWWGNDTGVSLHPEPRWNVSETSKGYFGPDPGHYP